MALPEKSWYPFDFLKSKEEHYGIGWFVTEDIALHTGSLERYKNNCSPRSKKTLDHCYFYEFRGSRNQVVIDSKYIQPSKHLFKI